MSDDEYYEDDFEGEFIWLDELEADLAVSVPLILPAFSSISLRMICICLAKSRIA